MFIGRRFKELTVEPPCSRWRRQQWQQMPRSLSSAAISPLDEPREAMPFDVLIVGGGPAGLAASIRLKQLCQHHGRDLSVCLIDKGRYVCHHGDDTRYFIVSKRGTYASPASILSVFTPIVRLGHIFYLAMCLIQKPCMSSFPKWRKTQSRINIGHENFKKNKDHSQHRFSMTRCCF